LGLGFERRDELAIHNDDEIPLFIRAEVAGQFEGLFVKDVSAVNAGFDDELRQQFDEAIHLRAARDSAAQSLIRAAGLALLLQLLRAR
jgi:hypothetical protein